MQLEWKQPTYTNWVCYDPTNGKIHGSIIKMLGADEYCASIHNHTIGRFVNENFAKQAVIEHLTNPRKADFLTEVM